MIREVERLFQAYQYGEAGRQLYDFFWSEFADWYVEIAKLQLVGGPARALQTARTLVQVLDLSLRMLHPFIPFVTEEAWRHLKAAAVASHPALSPAGGWPQALIVAPWPEPRSAEKWENEKIAAFSLIQELVRAIRNVRSEKNVKPGRRIPAIFVSAKEAGLLQDQAAVLAALSQLDLEALRIEETLPERPHDSITHVIGPVEIHLPLAGLVDQDDERKRVEKEIELTLAQVNRLEELLASPFAQKAPAAVVEKERQKLAEYKEALAKLQGQLRHLGKPS